MAKHGELNHVDVLGAEDVAHLVSVLSEALPGSPLWRFVLEEGVDDPAHRERLVAFMARYRLLCGGTALGVRGATGLDAAVVLSYPFLGADTSESVALREETWAALGAGARRRYESFDRATDQLRLDAAHIRINMLGVRHAARGQGMARALFDAVHELSVFSPPSAGVTLCTELESNLALCQHLEYEMLGSASVDSAFTTWGMYRRNQ